MPYPVPHDPAGFSQHGISPIRKAANTATGSNSCIQMVASPRANHPSMFPRSPSQHLPSTADRNMVSPVPVGMMPAGRPELPSLQPLPVVDRRKDTGSNRVCFSWNGAESLAGQWDSNKRGITNRDAEDTIMRRIIETREELGRVQKENAECERHMVAHAPGAAHEGRPLYAEASGRTGAYNWTSPAAPGEDDSEWWPRYDEDEVMLGRWPDREQQLLKELEFTNAKLQRERKRKSRRDHPLLKDTTNNNHLSGDLGTSSRGDASLAGWDCYVPNEHNDIILPASFYVFVGDRFDYTSIQGSKGQGLEKRFIEAAEVSIAEFLRQPPEHTHITSVELLTQSTLRMHAVFDVNRLDVQSVKHHIHHALQDPRPYKLNNAAKVLKETGRPAKAVLHPLKSWVGSAKVSPGTHGYGLPAAQADKSQSSTAYVRIDRPYKDFDIGEAEHDIATEMGLQPSQVHILDAKEGVVAEMQFTDVRDAEAVLEKFEQRCKDRRDPIHTDLGKVQSVQRRNAQVGSVKSSVPPERDEEKRRRRREEDGSVRRRRREDSESPRRRRREDSESPRRRRREDSESPRSRRREDSESPRRRRREDSESSRRRRRRDTAQSLPSPSETTPGAPPSEGHRPDQPAPVEASPSRSRRRRTSASPARTDTYPQYEQPQLVNRPMKLPAPPGSSYPSKGVPSSPGSASHGFSSQYAKAPASYKSAAVPPFKLPPSQRPSSAQE